MEVCYSDTKLICGCHGGHAESVSKKRLQWCMEKLLVLMDMSIILTVFVDSWMCHICQHL